MIFNRVLNLKNLKQQKGFLSLFAVLTLFISACNNAPEHAKYIPKDALIVAEINTKELSKKIAWSMLSSQNLWAKIIGANNKIDSTRQSEFIKNMQKAGVDELNTFYTYLKKPQDNIQKACFVVLIPLKNANKWEDFIKQTFNTTHIIERNKRKEAKLSDNIYAGWINNLLILVSVQDLANENLEIAYDHQTDNNYLAKNLDEAFKVNADNSMLSDKRFKKFYLTKCDLGFWVNIDDMMNSYGVQNLDKVTGTSVSLSNAMWRNSAFSVTTNFEKGKIATNILMYSSDALKDINKQYPPDNVDKDLLNKISQKNLDFISAYKMSPMATLQTIDKLGLLGMANSYLKEADLSVEEVLSAFSGDWVLAINNFNLTQETVYFDSSDKESAQINYRNNYDALFVFKLTNVETFKKIINWTVSYGIFTQTSQQSYTLNTRGLVSNDVPMLILKDNYAAFSNKKEVAENALQRNASNNPTSLLFKENIENNPIAIYYDYHNWVNNNLGLLAIDKPDSTMLSASTNLIKNIVFNGGNLSNDAFQYHFNINMMNSETSSIIQLIDFGKVIKEAQQQTQTAIE